MDFLIKHKFNMRSIHDIAIPYADRRIKGIGRFAVVLASYYGGKGYTTHKTESAAIKKALRLKKEGYSYKIIDETGRRMEISGDALEFSGEVYKDNEE